jgi:hypothetical protein
VLFWTTVAVQEVADVHDTDSKSGVPPDMANGVPSVHVPPDSVHQSNMVLSVDGSM